MTIDILIESPAWNAVSLDAVAKRAFAATFEKLGLAPGGYDISLLATDDDQIADLNAQFRGKASPTNVLSWPSDARAPATPGAMPDLPVAELGGPVCELGDIALAHTIITHEATQANKPFDHHLTHLLVHGLLHLLGFDHITDADADLMENLETDILAHLGMENPY